MRQCLNKFSMTSDQTSINSEIPCCTKKTVVVAVYVEKPRSSRRFSSTHQIQHKKHRGGCYDRRAELLRYSRRLRDSADDKPLSPLSHKPVLSGKRREEDWRIPDCMSKWRILDPRSCTNQQPKKERRKRKASGIKSDKIKSIVKKFEVRKNLGFVSKLLSKLLKRR